MKKPKSHMTAEKAERRASMLNSVVPPMSPISYHAEIADDKNGLPIGRVVQTCMMHDKNGKRLETRVVAITS